MDADGLSINIIESGGSSSRRKKRRFYGNKNYRNAKRARYMGQGSNQPLKLNTARVKISSPSPKSEQELWKKTEIKGQFTSTALHFKGVEVESDENVKKIKKVRSRPVKLKKMSSENSVLNTSDKTSKVKHHSPAVQKPVVGQWKSSLFNQNPEVPRLIQPDVQQFKEDVFSGRRFTDLDIHPHMLSYINEKLKLETMTAIQQKAIPTLLSGKDALVKSQTGSGKTLAYAIPVVQKIQEINKPLVTRKDGPVALVLIPTRELALQSYEIFSKLTLSFCRIVATWIIGGENRKSEKSRIRKGVNILIGTPGRVLDHIQTTESLSLKSLRWLIFDEADRLLDMGFQKQIDAIISTVRNQSQQHCQKVLLSATLSEKVERLASIALDDPIHIQVTSGDCDSGIEKDTDNDEAFALPEKLSQHVCVVPSKLRLVCLATFLKAKQTRNSQSKILVFFSCRDSTEFHYNLLKHVLRKPKLDVDFSVPLSVDLAESEMEETEIYQLHGGLSQTERHNVFNKFSNTNSGILLTTDVAARGLDLPSVNWVVQYTSPGNPVDYIHRAGRTARAGKKGNTLLMLTPSEVKYVNLLTQFNIQVKEMNVDDILTMAIDASNSKRKSSDVKQRIIDAAKSEATTLQNQIEFHISKNVKIKTLARTAYMSFVRAYATYPTEIKSIFHVKHLHLGHVAKSFGLQDAPQDIVKTLQKSVGQLSHKTSFEYRESIKEAAKQTKEEKSNTEGQSVNLTTKPRSRKQIMRNKMSRKPDLMSEFSSGF